MPEILNLLLYAGTIVAYLCLIAGILAFWVPSLELLNDGRPLTLIATVILLFAALVSPDALLLAATASVFLATLVLFLVPFTTAAARRRQAPPFLRVLTFNIEASNTRYREIGQFIAATEADILVIQEIDAAAVSELMRELGKIYRHVVHGDANRATGLALIAKQSCVDSGRVELTESNPAMVWTQIQKGAFSCEVIGVYLADPFHPRMQVRHIEWLIHYVRSRRHRLIVAGDFNLTPFSAKLNKFAVATGLRRHATLLTSWPADKFWPAFLIDHIFACSEFCSVKIAASGPSLGSDHRPIVADIGLNDDTHERDVFSSLPSYLLQ